MVTPSPWRMILSEWFLKSKTKPIKAMDVVMEVPTILSFLAVDEVELVKKLVDSNIWNCIKTNVNKSKIEFTTCPKSNNLEMKKNKIETEYIWSVTLNE